MVNLFLRTAGEAGSLTAALLALLEHSDRNLVNGFLERAGMPYQAQPGTNLEFRFPDPGPNGAPLAGSIDGPGFHLRLAAQGPGEPVPAAADPGTLLVTFAGRSPSGARAITWEQVDRWLAAAAGRYDPETRTGFLVQQFREFMQASGIEFFAGFSEQQVRRAPEALAELSGFYKDAGSFFDRLGPALAGVGPAGLAGAGPGDAVGAPPAGIPGLAVARCSRPEDQLAGYLYRDYTGSLIGPTGFLRVAFHLHQQELQVAVWLAPGLAGAAGDPHARLRTALAENQEFLNGLRLLDGDPLLWLWSAEGSEQKLPLDEFSPQGLTDLDWGDHQAGLQAALPFAALPGEGLVQRVGERVEAMLAALAPVLSPLH